LRLGIELPRKGRARRWLLLLTVVLPHLLLVIIFSKVAEEVGWTGFLQARLQERHAPLTASAIVTLPFAVAHLPGWFIEVRIGPPRPLRSSHHVDPSLVQPDHRGVFYNGTGGSVLLVGLFHSSFNVTTAEFGREFITSSGDVLFFVTSGIVIAAEILIAAITRGHLSYQASVALGASTHSGRADEGAR
jgi:uncharacterized protein